MKKLLYEKDKNINEEFWARVAKEFPNDILLLEVPFRQIFKRARKMEEETHTENSMGHKSN